MKVVVTHLKAAWPEGTKVGDIVDIGDSVPPWAAGKCRPAPAAAGEAAADAETAKPAKAKK